MLPKIIDDQKAKFRNDFIEICRTANASNFMNLWQNLIAITADLLFENSKHLLKHESVKLEFDSVLIQVTQSLMSSNDTPNDNTIGSQGIAITLWPIT